MSRCALAAHGQDGYGQDGYVNVEQGERELGIAHSSFSA